LLWVLVLVAPAHATFPGGNGKIAFTEGTYLDSCIYSINADGGSKAQVTPCGGASLPAWAADGRRLAYSASRYGEIEYVTDGQNPTLVYDSAVGTTGHGWSPDGSRLAVTYGFSDALGNVYTGLFTIRPDGSQYSEIQISSDSFFETPDWSPDGTKIAFYRVFTPEFGIYTVKADGTGLTPLAIGDASGASDPSWSPDGRKIAFSRGSRPSAPGDEDIWVMNGDGTGQTRLTTDPKRDLDPSWSPDGTKIAFASNRDDPNVATCGGYYPEPPCSFDIFVMNTDGSNQRNVTNTPTIHEGQPSWQPIPGPKRSDYKNAAQFCKAEHDFLGGAAFTQKHGGGANAYGKCVSQNH
jgi:TolB protein